MRHLLEKVHGCYSSLGSKAKGPQPNRSSSLHSFVIGTAVVPRNFPSTLAWWILYRTFLQVAVGGAGGVWEVETKGFDIIVIFARRIAILHCTAV